MVASLYQSFDILQHWDCIPFLNFNFFLWSTHRPLSLRGSGKAFIIVYKSVKHLYLHFDQDWTWQGCQIYQVLAFDAWILIQSLPSSHISPALLYFLAVLIESLSEPIVFVNEQLSVICTIAAATGTEFMKGLDIFRHTLCFCEDEYCHLCVKFVIC